MLTAARAITQVIHTVTKLLNVLEGQGALSAPIEVSLESAPPSGPSDERSMIVREILDSERKYVQDLEVLQVSYSLSRERVV